MAGALPPDVRSEFYAPVKKTGILGDADRKALIAKITDAIASAVVLVYRRLHSFVEDEYAAACRTTVGIGSVPVATRSMKHSCT